METQTFIDLYNGEEYKEYIPTDNSPVVSIETIEKIRVWLINNLEEILLKENIQYCERYLDARPNVCL